MNSINVWICGALGKMGSTLCEAISQTDDITITGIVSPDHSGEKLQIDGGEFEIFESLASLARSSELPDVIVDFTVAAACYDNAKFSASNGINFVTGTTGLNSDQKSELYELFIANNAKAIFASNFSVGAVLMMHFAAQSAKHFEKAEIVEIHHTQKVDAPSGTALTTQEMMASQSDFSQQDIEIHSLRLPGSIAHQHVYLSSPGEVLRIEHDANDRKCFMPGIILSIRKVNSIDGVINSIESLLFDADN